MIKRYIELLYHLQSFYERITDQLFNGNTFLKNEYEEKTFDFRIDILISLVKRYSTLIVEKLLNNYRIVNQSGKRNYLNFKIFSKISLHLK